MTIIIRLWYRSLKNCHPIRNWDGEPYSCEDTLEPEIIEGSARPSVCKLGLRMPFSPKAGKSDLVASDSKHVDSRSALNMPTTPSCTPLDPTVSGQVAALDHSRKVTRGAQKAWMSSMKPYEDWISLHSSYSTWKVELSLILRASWSYMLV